QPCTRGRSSSKASLFARRDVTEGSRAETPGSVTNQCQTGILGRREAEIARVHISEVASAQEVEREAAHPVEQGDQRQELARQKLTPAEQVDTYRDRCQDQRVVEAEIVSGSSRETD